MYPWQQWLMGERPYYISFGDWEAIVCLNGLKPYSCQCGIVDCGILCMVQDWRTYYCISFYKWKFWFWVHYMGNSVTFSARVKPFSFFIFNCIKGILVIWPRHLLDVGQARSSSRIPKENPGRVLSALPVWNQPFFESRWHLWERSQ